MERLLHTLSYSQQDHLRTDLGFSTTHDTSMDITVPPGDCVELLNSYGKIRRVKITQKISRPMKLVGQETEYNEYYEIIYTKVGKEDNVGYFGKMKQRWKEIKKLKI